MLKKMILTLLAVFALAVSFGLYFFLKNPNPDRPARIEAPNGFVQAHGTNLYDGSGNLLQLRGVNLGNWFIQEFWMGVNSVGSYGTGVYTQLRAGEAMEANHNLSPEQIRELEALYVDTYIQEKDFQIISDLGMNVVRIPFTCYNLTVDGYTLREDAFEKLDWAVEMCERYDLYAIIDLHGAVGSQNRDVHSGDDAQYDLYGNETNMRATCDLWKRYLQNSAPVTSETC